MKFDSEAEYRRESARILASLVGAFGPRNLSLAEDVVQETFARALVQWPIKGVPANPAAWLHRVAKNLAVDAIRREKIYVEEGALEPLEAAETEEELVDDELKMLLMCCHPKLSTESQIALTLKAVCGRSVAEIAKALLCGEDAVAQRITRAKRALAGLEFELPTGDEADRRVSVLLQTLYLLFNEGYSRHSGADLTDSDLCDEAILLANRLSKTAIGDRPDTYALIALMLFHSSRLPTRINEDGAACLLEDQDRSQWDSDRIHVGLRHFGLSAQGGRMTTYHCEAAIAACHALSPTFALSDWPAILRHYDDLVKLNAGPVAALNRIVALSMVEGPEAGLAALDELGDLSIKDYYLLPATRARFLERADRPEEAIEAYEQAMRLSQNEAESKCFRNRIRRLHDLAG